MIGGPNDVLVESQINRALAAARETNLAPAAQAPPAPAPARRVEPVAAAPAASAAAPQPAQAAPAAQVPPAEVRPIRPEPASPAPAPTAPEASPPPAVAAPGPVHEPASAPAPAKAFEPAVAAQARPQARPLPARPPMPSPITPGSRATVTRLPNKNAAPATPYGSAANAAAGSNPVSGEPVAPLHGGSQRAAPAAVASASSPSPPAAPAAVAPVGPAHSPQTVSVNVAGTEAPMFVKAELKTGHSAPPPAEPPSPLDRRPAVPVANSPSAEKPAPKTEDPFGGLESLEAEMARLLGRESP